VAILQKKKKKTRQVLQIVIRQRFGSAPPVAALGTLVENLWTSCTGQAHDASPPHMPLSNDWNVDKKKKYCEQMFIVYARSKSRSAGKGHGVMANLVPPLPRYLKSISHISSSRSDCHKPSDGTITEVEHHQTSLQPRHVHCLR
jgi:hypothetical protein